MFFTNKDTITGASGHIRQLQGNSAEIKVIVKMNEEVKPKIDHNINLAGLLVIDADTALGKLEREERGILKGLYAFPKKLGNGIVYICNGAEFPNAEAVDLLLYLLHIAEKHNWPKRIRISSLNALAREVFGVKHSGKVWNEKIERLLTIWKFHAYYFKNCFYWKGKIIDAVMLGVIENFSIDKKGRGKPAILTVTFNEDFLYICQNTEWYRRPLWIELKKLRKETAKRLYMLALEYRPNEENEEIKDWKIYIDHNLKYWYRNALNSLANPHYLRPSIILKRLKGAIEEINEKTNLRMELQQTEEGNYCIKVKEVALVGAEKIEIPFDKLSKEDKTLLLSYVEEVAKEKGIKSVWGFLRSLTSKQIETWLEEARKYFGVRTTEKKKETVKEKKPLENPELIEMLREWGKVRFSDKPALYEVYFGKGKVLKACEQDKKIIFVCKDRILAKLINQSLKKEIEELFNREVEFVGKEEFGSVM